MKIAVLSSLGWPYVRRGTRIAFELAQYLARQGHDVHYIATKPGPRPKRDWDGELHLEYHRLVENPFLSMCGIQKLEFFSWTALLSMLRQEFDIVQSVFTLDAFAACLNKNIAATPYVHYMIDRSDNLHLVPKHGEGMLRRALKNASAVVVMSKFLNEELRPKFGIEGEIIPGTVDCEQFVPTAKVDGPPCILCTVSMTAERKRVDLLVRAFDQLIDAVPDAILQLSGHNNAETTERLLQLVRPRTRKAIHFAGLGRREDLPLLYAKATISVLPSVDEAFGLVIPESLACGTPVVATRSGGIPEIITDPAIGVLFEPDDGPDEVSKALLKGLELAGRPETSKKCRQHAENFSWERVGPMFERLYERTLLENRCVNTRPPWYKDGAKSILLNTFQKKEKKNETLAMKSLENTFNDAIDALDITYDTYWQIEHFRPKCLSIVQWIEEKANLPGRDILLLSSFARPLAMLLEKCGYQVEAENIVQKHQPWQESGDQKLVEDFQLSETKSDQYDMIICDDIIQYFEYPGRMLQTMSDRLVAGGLLMVITENVARSSARMLLLAGRNIYPQLEEHGEGGSISAAAIRVPIFRSYSADEVQRLMIKAGIEVLQSQYIIGKQAIKGGLFSISIGAYLYRNLYHLLQHLIPSACSHIYVAGKKK